MRICWFDLKELEDSYIVPVCLSQLWSKCPQHLVVYAYSHGNTVEDGGLVNHLFSNIFMLKEARFELPRIQVTGNYFFGEISRTHLLSVQKLGSF